MIRVLHYVGKMDRGGMETLIMNLYRNVDRNIIQFDFAIHGEENGDFEEEILSLGGHFFRFPHMRKNPIKYRSEWRKFWKQQRYNFTAFHMHTNSLANIIALEEAYRAGIPVRIVHSHSTFANKGKLQALNNFLHIKHRRKVRKIATDYFACSEKAALWMFGSTVFNNKDVLILNNGVDLKKFRYNPDYRNKVRKELGIENNTFVIGQVGSFLPVKNHDFSLELLSSIIPNNNKVILLFVGDGSEKNRIIELARSKKLDSYIRFLGVRKDVNEILSAMDLYIMPSHYEGLPVSLVEAQVNGVPAVVSINITDEVKFNENVVYLPIDSGVEEWVRTIAEMKTYIHDADTERIVSRGFDINDSCKIYSELLIGREKGI